jgi:hypothetical protein
VSRGPYPASSGLTLARRALPALGAADGVRLREGGARASPCMRFRTAGGANRALRSSAFRRGGRSLSRAEHPHHARPSGTTPGPGRGVAAPPGRNRLGPRVATSCDTPVRPSRRRSPGEEKPAASGGGEGARESGDLEDTSTALEPGRGRPPSVLNPAGSSRFEACPAPGRPRPAFRDPGTIRTALFAEARAPGPRGPSAFRQEGAPREGWRKGCSGIAQRLHAW